MWSLDWPNTASSPSRSLEIFSAKLKEQFSFEVLIFTFLFYDSKGKKKKTMGENLRRKFPFPAPSSDPLACVGESTRTNSDSSGSGLTIESFRDPTANVKPGQTMVWTNEKHNSYLEFLEASFVKQLHCPISLLGCPPQEEIWEPCPIQELPAKGHNSSHKFSVLQDCRCQKINYESNDPLLDSTADSSDILGSPWLHHFISAGKSSSTFPVPRETVVSNDGIHLKSNTNLVGCTTEVSDQNFVDEDQRGKTGRASGAKRLKTMAMLDASSNSQVVPLGKLNSEEDSIISNSLIDLPKKEKGNCCHSTLRASPAESLTYITKGELNCCHKEM